MARPKSPEPKSEQLNIRLSTADFDALRVLEFLSRKPAAEIVRELLKSHIDSMSADPRFIAAATARDDYNEQIADVLPMRRAQANE